MHADLTTPIHRHLLSSVIGCAALLVATLPAGRTAIRAESQAELSASDPVSTQRIEFFRQSIEPVLIRHCYACHSSSAVRSGKLKAGLRLDSRDAMLRGGDTGPAITPGNPADSLLIAALKFDSFEMPPSGKLPPAVIADFEQWIRDGAVDPRADTEVEADHQSKAGISATDHWAWQRLTLHDPPDVADPDWCENRIDHFVMKRLESHGLKPAEPADRATLLRRVSLDLTGLPPTPDETDAFLDDTLPGAYERVVDRLLASPHLGERWGRHWLDLARYADSSGYHNDLDRPTAWRYRDYVINSFNADKPYDEFTAEQLAGDEVPWASEDTIIATGFCRNAPSNDDNMGRDTEKYRLDQLDDVISTTSTVFLGLTLGCARCHDHKYDPITSAEYYQFLAVFNSTERHGGVKHIKSGKQTAGGEDAPLALIETSSKVRPTFVLIRGNHQSRGEEVGPGVPAILPFGSAEFSPPESEAKSTGRRRELARWISSSDNALTWRVLANRLWQHCFGRGIVETTSNLGLSGAGPTHPALLDDLARQLIVNEGRIKPVLRLIVTSATYQQASQASVAAMETDPENRLLSHQNVRRLEAEIIRDSILAASGNLNPQMHGPGIKPRIREELIVASQRNKWPSIKEENPEHWRRSVYIYVKRQLLFPMMELFDAPTTTDSCAVRPDSILPTQALILLNDEFTEDQAEALARRVTFDQQVSISQAIVSAFRRVLGRSPSDGKLNDAIAFVEDRRSAWMQAGESETDATRKALTDLCHVLFNSSEFVFVD